MTSRLSWFNAYLLLGLAALLSSGCQAFKKKEASTFRVHLEVNEDPSGRSKPVPVYRQNPIYVHVESSPFLNEGNVAKAYVVDALGAFQIMIQFDRRGTWVLEQYTTANKGRRFAIFSQFGDARWLAAPVINQRITDGLLVFTPDATREESERLVRGLNNVAKTMQKWNP
jgi:preprotein translocase subunit SecD